MGLIKSQNSPPSLTPFSLRDVEDQARALLVGARRTAERLLAEAQRAADELQTQARIEGFEIGKREGYQKGLIDGAADGRKDGLAASSASLRDAMDALNSAALQIEQSRQALEADALSDVVQLAIAVARRVTKRQGEIDPAVLVENLREAMRLVVHSADIRIAINPLQRAALNEALPVLKIDFPVLDHVAVIDDATVGQGGCRIFTQGGSIDADLGAQIDRIVNDLLPQKEGEACR